MYISDTDLREVCPLLAVSHTSTPCSDLPASADKDEDIINATSAVYDIGEIDDGQGDRSFDLELDTELKTELDQDFHSFLNDHSEPLVETDDVTRSELHKTTDHLHDLMSEMTLKVSEMSTRQESTDCDDKDVRCDANSSDSDKTADKKSPLLSKDTNDGGDVDKIMTSSLGV